MAFYLKGTRVPHKKHTANTEAVRMPIPNTVTIPTLMHIGAPAVPTVNPGDHVDVGTRIAEQGGFVSSHVYASVSGTVKRLEDVLLASGQILPAVVIESDGQMTPDPAIVPPVLNSREDAVEALCQSGIVGLGGAGFPTHVKFAVDKSVKIEELIINGAECEPYITSDSVTMLNRADDMAYGIEQLMKIFDIPKVVIGIEKNKPLVIQNMKTMAAGIDGAVVKPLPVMYPQGGEKVLIYHAVGKKVPFGKLPIDVGCVVCNCTTVAEIGRYFKTGMPLVERTVTVDGDVVVNPQNVIVPIGTTISEVFEFCGGFKEEPCKVLYGGPMMGIAVPHMSVPVLKNTNALLALSEKEAMPPKTTACIRCGACTTHCPFGINPAASALALQREDNEGMVKSGVEQCMECGCCSFVCPAKRPLVQNNKLAKAVLREFKSKEAK